MRGFASRFAAISLTSFLIATPVVALNAASASAASTGAAQDAKAPSPSNAAAAAARAAAIAADKKCTLSPSLDYSGGEQGSCIAVGAKLSAVPAVGQTAVLTVTVKAARAEPNTHVT